MNINTMNQCDAYFDRIEKGMIPIKGKKLNLGCGLDYRKGWTNLDYLKSVKADVYADIEKPLPFKDNVFDYVILDNVAEHVTNYIGMMSELRRICKNGAIIDIIVPHASNLIAVKDPTHQRQFAYGSFEFFTKEHFYELPLYEIVHVELIFTKHYPRIDRIMKPLINWNPKIYERLFSGIIPCEEIKARLRVIK